jgi:hypothetical protein
MADIDLHARRYTAHDRREFPPRFHDASIVRKTGAVRADLANRMPRHQRCECPCR